MASAPRHRFSQFAKFLAEESAVALRFPHRTPRDGGVIRRPLWAYDLLNIFLALETKYTRIVSEVDYPMSTFLCSIEKPSGLLKKLAYYFTRRQFGKVLTPLKVRSARVKARHLLADEQDNLRRQGQLFIELADLCVKQTERGGQASAFFALISVAPLRSMR
jgi:hypothetical protein